jgi:hypothetical protein
MEMERNMSRNGDLAKDPVNPFLRHHHRVEKRYWV